MRGAARVVRVGRSRSKLRRLISLLKSPAMALARIKHLICSLYFIGMGTAHLIAAPHETRSVKAYAPQVVGVGVFMFAILHGYGLYQTCRRPHRFLPVSFWSHYKLPKMSPSVLVTIFHLLDVVSQSYQAYRMSYYLIDRNQAFCFAFLMSLYCLITPWFLFAKHVFVRQTLVLIIDSYLGFILSTGFPLVIFVAQALRLVWLDRQLQRDDKFVTISLLVGRYLIVSSPLDLFTKFVIQASSYLSLRRLVTSMHVSIHSRCSTSAESTNESTEKFVSETFGLQFKPHRYLVAYLVLNLLWGMSLLALASYATWHRETCPDQCILSTSPWFTSSCHCAYVEINCYKRGISGESIDSLLDPNVIGTTLFFLDVRRCAIPNGIPVKTLTHFQEIYAIYIYFSNMTQWPRDPMYSLPEALVSMNIRGSNLDTVPQLFESLPSGLVYLRLQFSNITSIPDNYFRAWSHLYSIGFVGLKLESLPSDIPYMPNLVSLDLRGNLIKSISDEWLTAATTALPNLVSMDLSGNQLTDTPWKLLKPTTKTLDISSNPISTASSQVIDSTWLTSRILIVDETIYCNTMHATYCQPRCSSICSAKLVNNYRCDFECFTSACSYDGSDCNGWGFIR